MLIVIYSIYNNIIYILLIVKVILINKIFTMSSDTMILIHWKIIERKKWYLFVNIYSTSYREIHRSTTLVLFHLRENLKKKKITKKTIFYESRFSLSYRFHEWTVLLALLCSAKQSFYVTSTNHSAELTKFPTRRILMQSTNWFVEKLVGCFASLELTEFFLSLRIVITWEDTG